MILIDVNDDKLMMMEGSLHLLPPPHPHPSPSLEWQPRFNYKLTSPIQQGRRSNAPCCVRVYKKTGREGQPAGQRLRMFSYPPTRSRRLCQGISGEPEVPTEVKLNQNSDTDSHHESTTRFRVSGWFVMDEWAGVVRKWEVKFCWSRTLFLVLLGPQRILRISSTPFRLSILFHRSLPTSSSSITSLPVESYSSSSFLTPPYHVTF